MKSLFILLLTAITLCTANGQEFAFASSSQASGSSEKVGGYKKVVAQKVFDDLVRGRGDFRMQTPTLVLNKKDGNIASFNPDKIQVVLDEKAYDICVTFGKDSLNALAALLAHELIHYYEKHDWTRHFAMNNESLETARQLERMGEGLKQETEADNLGGFMAFSVGYNTYGIMPELLKKAYKAYDLSENMPGYPNLTDRLKMVEGAMKELQGLQIVFETANLLTVLGNYADASVYHRKILQTYQSREIYNNAGVNAALAALAMVEPGEMPYVLPLELDPKSRLYGIKNNDLEKDARKNALLKSALEHFERALALDENYATGYLNKACVLTLKGEWEDAEYALRKGKKKAPDALAASDFVVLEGIIAALQGDSILAEKHLEQAQKQGNNWAKVNLETLKKAPRPSLPAVAQAKGLEEIDEFPLSDFLKTPTTDREVKVDEKVFCGSRQFLNSRLYVHYANAGKNYALVQETQPGYKGRTLRGIGLGDGQEKITAAYGKATRSIALPNGSILVYPEASLFFRLSPQSKVESWGVYRKSEL